MMPIPDAASIGQTEGGHHRMRSPPPIAELNQDRATTNNSDDAIGGVASPNAGVASPNADAASPSDGGANPNGGRASAPAPASIGQLPRC
jgi:hypothetical protein